MIQITLDPRARRVASLLVRQVLKEEDGNG